MDALVRSAAHFAIPPLSTSPFFSGVIAYKQVLMEIRVSLALLLISLALLALYSNKE
jgi:hypothetical protein